MEKEVTGRRFFPQRKKKNADVVDKKNAAGFADGTQTLQPDNLAAVGRTDINKGLSARQVAESRKNFGENLITRKKRRGFFKSLLLNFGDPMIKILLIALGINIIFLFRHANWFETVGIVAAILIAVVVSTASEYGSESAFEKLFQDASNATCRVKREGQTQVIPMDRLVVGDIVLLGAGDKIPADGVLMRGRLDVDQSVLNGESKEAKKFLEGDTARGVHSRDKALNNGLFFNNKTQGIFAGGILQDKSQGTIENVGKRNAYTSNGTSKAVTSKKDDFLNPTQLFSGTVISGGEGVMLVTGVGDSTFYGRLAGEIQEETPQSPLKERLERLAGKISLFGYIGAGLVALSYLFSVIVIKNSFNPALIAVFIKDFPKLFSCLLSAATLAVTVIVMAVPEGLPMMITVVLSANMRRMLRDNVLVRRLNGIETAGSMNILFTDKTGTLTRGKLEVESIVTGDGRLHKKDDFLRVGAFSDLLAVSLACNCSAEISDGRAVGGNATDRALLEYAVTIPESGCTSLSKSNQIPFSSDNKFMSVTVSGAKLFAKNTTLTKGAPEKLLPRCTCFYNEQGEIVPLRDRGRLNRLIQQLNEGSIRVIAAVTSASALGVNSRGGKYYNGSKDIDNSDSYPDNYRNSFKRASYQNTISKDNFDGGRVSGYNSVKGNFGDDLNSHSEGDDLILVALIGIRDRVRKEAVRGVKQVQNAGIQTVMITGDSRATAVAIARETGIITSESDLVLTSDEIAALSDDDLKARLKNLRVVARALPSDKSRLVRIAQSMGLVVGMTGDGVNDAPALKKADIGFAMGSGTEVAKEAGDVVILDDNILSISRAVCYGRTIFKSIRKFIIFQLSINFCAIAVSVVAPLLDVEMPITVIQMLWINLVMDTLAGLAFGGERPRASYMAEPPKKRDEPIINGYMWQQIIITSICTATLSLWFLKSRFIQGGLAGRESTYAMTAFFTLFMFAAIFGSLNARTHKLNLTDYLALNKQFLLIMGIVTVMQIALVYFGGAVFRTQPLEFKHLLMIIGIAFTVVPVDLIRKAIGKKLRQKQGT